MQIIIYLQLAYVSLSFIYALTDSMIKIMKSVNDNSIISVLYA